MNENYLDNDIKEKLKSEVTEIPEIVRVRIDETLDSIPQHTAKSNKLKYSVMAAVASFFLIFSAAFFIPSMAHGLKQVPVLGSVFEFLGDIGLKQSSEKGLSSQVNESATDQDITITITDVHYDGLMLSIGYNIESDQGMRRPGWMDLYRSPWIDLKVNRKRINTGSGGRSEQIGENKYAGVMTFTPREELPNEFSLTMDMYEMSGWIDGQIKTIEGNWKVTIPVVKQTQDTFVIDLEGKQMKKHKDTTLSLKKITFNPRSVAVEADLIQTREDNSKADIQLQIYDDQGMLQPLEGSGNGSPVKGDPNLWKTEIKAFFAPMDKQPTYLIIKAEYHEIATPISSESSDSKVEIKKSRTEVSKTERAVSQPELVYERVKITDELPITIAQGEAGQITITSVEFTEAETILYYEVYGEKLYDQAMALSIEDALGERYYREFPPQRDREKPNSYSFKTTFPPIKQDQEIFISTREVKIPTFVEELEINIPVHFIQMQ